MQTEPIHMSDLSDRWTEEIESLAEENSVKVLSIILGITNGEAADKLLEHTSEPSWKQATGSGFRRFLAVGKVLSQVVHTTSKISSYRTGLSSHVQFADKFPTVGQWLEENPEELAILRVGSCFVYVGVGVVLNKSEVYPRHGQATHVIFLNEEEEEV